ncbi:hypothetical protein ACUVZD_000146 [Pseudomonas aeruginosa]
MLEIEPTDEQVAALALPGDDWPAGRARARRLLNAVKQCVPCPDCDQLLSTPEPATGAQGIELELPVAV